MARGQRLIPKTLVDRWEVRLRAAVVRALNDQLVTTRAQLAQALTAAGNQTGRKVTTAAIAGVAVYNLWSDQQWQKYLALYLEPEVDAIVSEAAATAASAVGGSAVWGFADSGVMSEFVMATAIGAGAYLGLRLADAGQSGTPQDSVDAVLQTAPAILGGLIGALAGAIANSASTQVGQYVVSAAGQAYAGAVTIWNAMDDDRTREAHADADGQVVAVGEPFVVDGEELMYPGDPAGSDGNILNCRCWQTFEGLSDAQAADAEVENPEAA